MAAKSGATKASTKKKKMTTQLTDDPIEQVRCSCCGSKDRTRFYMSVSEIHKYNGCFPVCKLCMNKVLDNYLASYEDNKYAFYLFCRKFDIYFSTGAFEGALKDAARDNGNIVGRYMKQINSFRTANKYGACFEESEEFLDRIIYEGKDDVVEDKPKSNSINKRKISDWTEAEEKNKEDVFRILGYDPFENEQECDKPRMYTMLIDYLDENTQSDNFKIPIVIQIVTYFNQVERINKALANLDTLNNIGEIAKLTAAKSDIIKSTLSMAKDNGISVNHSNNKSKGAGTLSGIIKSLNDMNLKEANINLFDIETNEGMRQVADISNRSILDQLMLDENSYTEMINDQRALIIEHRERAEKFEEEARVLKAELNEIKNNIDNNK
jgi:hypothetical protein